MATDGPTPAPCDPEIFQKGVTILAVDGSSNAIENWVKAVAKKANARLDWHYSGGIGDVLFLGSAEERARVEAAIIKLTSTLKGRILKRYAPNEAGLYRQGVTPVPDGAVAAFMDPTSGQNVFIVEDKSNP